MRFKMSRRPNPFPGRQGVGFRRKLLARIFEDIKRRERASKVPRTVPSRRHLQAESAPEVGAPKIKAPKVVAPEVVAPEIVTLEAGDVLIVNLNPRESGIVIGEHENRESEVPFAESQSDEGRLEIMLPDQQPSSEWTPTLRDSLGEIAETAVVAESLGISTSEEQTLPEDEQGDTDVSFHPISTSDALTPEELFYDRATGLIEDLSATKPEAYSYDLMNEMRSQVETMLAEWESASKYDGPFFGSC